MKAEFTAGPWHIPTSPEASGAIAHASGYVAFTGSPRKADETRMEGESWLDMYGRTQSERDLIAAEQDSNRRLIAAAPDLLEALKYALRMVRASECDIAFIKAAIDKATAP